VENSRGPRSSSESVADKIAVRMIAQKSSRTLELGLGWMTAFALLLVAAGSIQVSLASAAVIENAFRRVRHQYFTRNDGLSSGLRRQVTNRQVLIFEKTNY
jgi:hypothetical protein